MTEYVITAGYVDSLGNQVTLGIFKTEEKAWKYLDIECLRLKRLSDNPVEIERLFEDTRFVLLTSKV